MSNKRIFTFALLIAIAATASSWRPGCSASEDASQQPAPPTKESEEQEEAFGEFEIEDGDEFETFATISNGFGWSSRVWLLHNIEIEAAPRLCLHNSGHCRAPPASAS